jgi:hypothetical protein
MFVEDLSIFFQDFALLVGFVRDGVQVAAANMILDAVPTETAVYDRSFYDEKFYSAKVSGQHVTLYGVAADLANVRVNDTTNVNGDTWYVIGFDPDGTGLMTVHLSLSKVQ